MIDIRGVFNSWEIELKSSMEDLSFLIKFTIKEFQGLIRSRSQKIVLNIHDNLITRFEKERIHEVIGNLLTNAIKYTPPFGTVEIKTEIKENFYIISVKDNGIGCTEQEKEKLFKQFGKIEHYGRGSYISTEGTGLGLYITKKLVELHGGEIWMESEGRNKGSIFYFSLPINKE
ncbi:Adaptive-response sensory-kinase SasA [subsurface metagenome]